VYETTLPSTKPQSDRTSNELLGDLGRALVPILPVDEPSGPDLALQLLKRSFCRQTLEKLHTCHVLATEPKLIDDLLTLPTEILSEFVAPHIIPSQLRYVLPILGETCRLLQGLRQWPARSFSLSCQDSIFATRVQFGNRSYITDLSVEQADDSFLVKSRNVPCRFLIVWLDRVGITHVEFQESSQVESAPQGSKWVYAVALTEGKIYIKSKVYLCFQKTFSANSCKGCPS
jgi:hypothetical protein